MDARRVAEETARASYGRLVAYLAARSRDVAGAEDALGEAFRAALERWPRDGVPDKPEAWLLAVARRQMIDHSRRSQTQDRNADVLRMLADENAAESGGVIPDERLKLLFICAHPAIDAAARTPLMLQTVLGLDALRIASAFLVSPAAMGQRLARAKAKIRDAGIAFGVPEPADLPDRLEAVLDAIYAAYGTGWEDAAGADPRRSGLATEAIWLARLATALLPREPEALGLLALMLHCEARRPSRRDSTGAYVPLSEQDTARWDRAMTDEAESVLLKAAAFRQPGRFQLEAAIQSAHARRAIDGVTDWAAIVQLYDQLVRVAPGVGAQVSRAAALSMTEGAPAGLAALDNIASPAVGDYQPYWAVRAHLLAERGELTAAREAYARAIGLSEDERVRAFLIARCRSRTGADPAPA